MQCTPEDVFAVLSDGWLYGMWVVGSARIRDVDATWPEAGSRIHHSVGAWPLLLSDESVVEEVDRPHRLQLRVKGLPAGEGRVILTCTSTGEGETQVVIEEYPVRGPATLVPKPIERFLLHARNVEALKRLSYLAENRARSAG
jgi:uncharacterized protein YndB with AHSA1/START domain